MKNVIYAVPTDALQEATRNVLFFLAERFESAMRKDPSDAMAAIAYDLFKTQQDIIVLIISSSIAYAIGNKDRIPCQALEGTIQNGRVVSVRELLRKYMI